MESYTSFAYVYEEFMDNVPYDTWTENIVRFLKENGVESGLVCELGCGTGSITRRLKAKGFDMIGIDLSAEMLEIARFEHVDESEDILYLNQDMREFELYGTVNAIVSVCDSMCYLLEEEDLLKTFKLVNNYLEKDGVFVFDMNTIHKYRDVIGDRVIAENRDDASLIWENYYDEEKNINQYDITIYTLCDDEEPIYERMEETHLQRAYEPAVIKRLIEEAGLKFVKMLDADTLQEVTDQTERIYYVAKEGYQPGKYYE